MQVFQNGGEKDRKSSRKCKKTSDRSHIRLRASRFQSQDKVYKP